MQWLVITVLVVGGAVGGYIMMHKVGDLQDSNTTLTSERDDLRSQLHTQQQASAASPSPSASPSASPTPATAPVSSPATATATHTNTPTPTPAKR